MTDREWPEYPNQSGGETVTGPESAQEEAASERGWEADPPSPASEECQSEEGSNWERTAQEAEEEVPGGQRGEDLGTLGQAQELQEAFFREEGSEPSQTTETSGWKPGMESSGDSREEPDLPAESPESSGQELQEAVALSPEETQVPFQTENAWEPGAERPENADGGESQEPVAERSSAQPYDQSPAFSRPAPQAPPPVWNPGWQAPYHQAPQNYPYGQGQYQGGWHPQQRQVPPPYYGGTPYQAPNPYQNQAPYGYPGQAARNQGQPGYQESRWYPQQPTQPAPTGSVPPPSQPPQKEAGELPDAKPPEKKRMNKKTKAFLWVIGAVLVLLGAAMVLYSVGLTSGWFGGETAEPPQASSSTPAPEDDQKLLEIEEIPQDGMMTPNQVYEKVKHSVVAVVTYGQGSDLTDSPISSGSGIVFSEDGYIVTNSHVIGDSNQYPVKVVFTGQDENEEDQEYPAQIVGYDKMCIRDRYGIEPDVITSAKGLGGGLPIGACLCASRLGEVLGAGMHGTTFGGNPVSCAGGLEVLQRVAKDSFLRSVEEKGRYLREKLSKMAGVQELRGLGMMIGIVLAKDNAKEVAGRCVKNGLLVLTAKTVLRLLPPLNITYEEIDQGLEILEKSILEG